MKKLFLTFFSALTVAVSSVALGQGLTYSGVSELMDREVVRAELPRISQTPGMMLIARGTVSAFLRYHYSKVEFTPQLCSQWYVNYFQMLDPMKIYFLKSDLEEFAGYEEKIGVRGQPNVDFAFKVYRRFLERLREWAVFTYGAYEPDRNYDFSEKEYIVVYDKPEDHDWPATDEERQALWRLRVKNTLLADMLTQKDIEARKKDVKPGGASGEEHRAVYTPPPIRLRSQNAVVNTFINHKNAEPLEVLSYFLNAFAGLLDPHTCYLAPDRKEDFDIGMSLSLQGIGATLTSRDSYTVVVSLVPGGPAATDGRLKPGDKIVAVAQSAEEEPNVVIGMPLSKVVRQIRGVKGTGVYLTIQPESSQSEYVLRLTRDEIKLKESEAQSTLHTVDGKRILNIYLPSFYRDFNGYGKKRDAKSTTNDVLRLLREARASGPVDGVILDMRDNGGGSLEEAILLTSAFLRAGGGGMVRSAIVQTRDSDWNVTVRTDETSGAEYAGPLMVIVDRGAASATEILAACLQDTARAVIVGDPGTHGKGTVQTVVDLGSLPEIRRNGKLLGSQEPGSLKMTIQKFYRVTGGSTQIKGVAPDIQFPSFQMAFRNTEADLPHVLPWDEIAGATRVVQTRLGHFLPELQKFYKSEIATTPEFVRYAKEVEEYMVFREDRKIPLELAEREAYREREIHAARRIRHYQPNRKGDDQERLHDADESIYDDGAPREDVVLDASLKIMGRMIELDAENDNKAFSLP